MAVGLPVIYANLIINGLKSYEDIPERIKPDVKKVLESMELGHLIPKE